MIANCPSCGTHYKLDRPQSAVRARCGRCDTGIEVSNLRPYRIVGAEPAKKADPGPAARAATDFWREDEPLPAIPEMTHRGAFEASVPAVPESDILTEASSDREAGDPFELVMEPQGGLATFVMWVAAGAIAGTGISWTMGGETLTGIAGGAAIGAIGGWGWSRWTSRR